MGMSNAQHPGDESYTAGFKYGKSLTRREYPHLSLAKAEGIAADLSESHEDGESFMAGFWDAVHKAGELS